MDGIIIINKEKGYTSNDIVQIVRHTLKEKVGHIGTLDPNATGVLPLLIGKGTKISKYLINHDKIYETVLKLGVKTETADGEGKVIDRRNIKKDLLNDNNIRLVFKEFTGEIEQTPPIYSAIKIDGKKLYEYARKGQKVDVQPRKIKIYDIELINNNLEENEISFKVECSKGTYIRTLCEDIAEKFETVGYMKELRRVQVGEFNIDEAINIDELKANKDDIRYLEEHIISVENIVDKFNKIKLNNDEIKKFLNGIKLYKREQDGIYKIYNEKNIFIGTGIIENKKLKRDVVIER